MQCQCMRQIFLDVKCVKGRIMGLCRLSRRQTDSAIILVESMSVKVSTIRQQQILERMHVFNEVELYFDIHVVVHV